MTEDRSPALDTPLSPEDLEALREARGLLEDISLAARLADLIGKPLETLVGALPAGASGIVNGVTRTALDGALRVALTTLDHVRDDASNVTHKVMAGLSGAAGGAFGLPALSVELPVSTTIILRSIADIARAEGEDIRSTEARVQCLGVFALGGKASNDDAAESGYFASRVALAELVKEATVHLASSGLRSTSAPVLVRLVEAIATRFGVQVTQKVMAQAVPVIGAAGGALVNTLFIDHFQSVARGHFTVRRLERQYGEAPVREAYEALGPVQPGIS